MAGEEILTTGATAAVSVPLVVGSETVPPGHGEPGRDAPGPQRNLAPYDATSHWRPWPALGMVAVVMALALAAAIGGGLAILAMSPTGETPRNAKLMLALLAAQIIMVAGTLLLAGAKGDSRRDVLALKAPAGGLWAYLAALIVMLASVGAYTAVTSLLFNHDAAADLGDVIEVFRGPWWPLALVVIGVGAPLSEELMFRGFLQTALARSRLGYWGAALVTTSIWTALHAGYSPVGMGEVFMIGIIFALFLRRTGSLRVTLVCHAIYNSAIALVMIFGPKDLLG